MFALEYATWFDYLVPGLARLGIPIPLGGTSNHFRTDILRRIWAWDAFNVTEDADLGIRLARCGYTVHPLDSTTFEEAVGNLPSWIRQRSRWLKGYLQTVMVHMRTPRDFAHAIGLTRFLALGAFLGGAVMTGLLAPLFWGLSLVWSAGGGFADQSAVLQISAVVLLVGNAILTVMAMMAPLKRRWFALIPFGLTVFVYGLLISVASYRAAWQFVTRPFFWEKTTHGLRLADTCGRRT